MPLFRQKQDLVSAADALPGRSQPLSVPESHFVNGHRLQPPFPDGFGVATFAMGCFWGAERHFWEAAGVWSTAAGYAGGFTPNPTYEEVCSGRTGHAESVLVVWDPGATDYEALLAAFWENHDPTQGMRQGNDVGTQYRSAIYTHDEAQAGSARRSLEAFQTALERAGYGRVTTEVAPAGRFYYAEGYHQQYLARNVNGYCGLGGTGVACPAGTGVAAAPDGRRAR